MSLKDKMVLVWVISLSYEVVMTSCEVVLVNRNVNDSFRVGKDGCTNNASVCTSVFTACQDDGSCLCNSVRPSFRNPVIKHTGAKIISGDSYGCVDDDIIRFRVHVNGKCLIACAVRLSMFT